MTDNENKNLNDKEEKVLSEEDINISEEISAENQDNEKIKEDIPEKEEKDSNENEEDIDRLKEELNTTKDKLLRSLADNENLRKHMEKSRIESLKYGVQPLARELLNVVDNFERALPQKEIEKKEPILEGVRLIKKEIQSILEKFSVKKVVALGEDFDANYHQAMFEKETKDFEQGKICEIIQDGYMFHDRLLRPSLVAVSKRKTSDMEDPVINNSEDSSTEEKENESIPSPKLSEEEKKGE